MPKATTPRRTPGRTQTGEKRYILFNDDPRHVGTQSGRPMPTDVPLNEDGFEDPAAFMRSPTASVMNSASRRTTLGGVSVAPSSVGQARRRTLGRMSQMDGSDDDDVGYPPHDDFDDDVGDTTFFGKSNPRNVSLPRPSHLGPATPTTEYDDLPSPSVSKSASKRKSAFGLSPSGSRRLTKGTTLRSPLATQDVEDDSMALGGDDDDVDQTLSPSIKKRKTSRRQTEANDDDEEEEENVSRRKGKQSLASTRPTVNDDEDEGQEDFYDAPADLDDAGQDFGGYDDDDDVGEGPSGANASDVEEEEEGTEEQIDPDVQEDEEQEEGSDDQEPAEASAIERATTKKKVPKVTKPGHKRQARVEKHVPTARSARLSGIDYDASGRYVGDFKCRRSGRTHYAPLEFWNGDRVVYGKGKHLAEIQEVVRVAKEEPIPFAQRRKASRRRSNSTPNGRGSTAPDDGIADGVGCDDETLPEGIVLQRPIDGDGEPEEAEIAIAMPRHRFTFKGRVNGMRYSKVFGEASFAAAGVIRLEAGQTKPGKSSKDNAYFFFVHKGGLNVNIHRTSFNLGPGGICYVPRDNKYSIHNISDVEAEIFFAQARQSVVGEANKDGMGASTSETPAPRAGKSDKTSRSESEATPKAVKKKVGRPAKS